MTPPPGSLINDFEDIHVMETRHPLTIPAALVLGTAIATTALPLPRFTPATASGTTHVTRAYTDKSTHSPGSQATITAEASGGGTVHFSVSHLGTEVASGEAPITDGAATWTYTTPSEDNQGYLVTATGADDTHAETALDVSSSWTRFPRMGYVSHFKPTAPADITTGTSYESYLSLTPSEYIAKLSQDYRINALQYYDWQYRHEQPVATGDFAEKWPLWWVNTPEGTAKPKNHMTMMNVNTQGWRDYITDQYVTQKDAFGFDGTHIDTLGQTVKKEASGNSVDLTDGLTALVNETASKIGTATGINLPDGAGTDKIGPSSASYIYTELWDHNETNQQVASYLQGARDKSANKPQIVAAYANNYDPASWVADPSDSNKQIHPQVTPDEGTRIEAESDQASVSGGAHILSGDDSASGGAYAGDFSAGGSTVTFTIDAGQGGTFTFTTRYARQDDDPAYHQMILDMGQPTQKLITYVHFDQTGSYYTWKDMTETVELTPGVHTISYWVPNDKNYTPVNIDCITFREFNSASVKLADAAFVANGAHHLELGDYGRMLDNEFFVNSGRSMSPDLQAWMKNYYNISTAYENLLYGDHLTRQERQVEVSTGGVSLPTSTDGAANTIWANTMTSDAGTALHLINLRTNDQDGNDEYWRNAAKQTLPFGDTSVTYHLAAGEPAPASVFVVSPDNDGGRPTQLDVTLGTDEQGNATVTFNVGWLSTWDMVVFSPTKDADRAGTEASASEAVTGQVRNGLGQCLSAQDAQAANGTPVWNSDCDAQGTAEQTVTYQDNHLMIGGRCVDVLANGTADGSVVHLWDCYPALPSQQWDRNDAGQYVNRGSGTCLTIPNDTTTTSTQAIIAQCSSSSPSQRWSAPRSGRPVAEPSPG
mgnify:CR=1 FL=1